jgi:UDP-glucose 4-epimerase
MNAPAESRAAGNAKAHRDVITGATGQLGRHVLNEIAAWPDTQVLALVRTNSKLADTPANVRVENLPCFDANSLAPILERFQPTAIVHCAATGMLRPRPNWLELIRCNVNLSAQLCELAARIPGCHFIHISSGLAYRDQGRPLVEDDPLDSEHPYAATKIAAEVLVRAVATEAHVPLTIVRPFSFSGAGDKGSRLFPSLLRAAEQQRTFDLSPGDQIRDHSAVNDIAHGIALAVARRHELPPETQVFNFGSGNTVPLRNLIEGVVAELGLKVKLNFAARNHAPFEPKYLVADVTRARSMLNWHRQINFAHAIWELAQESFPGLQLKQPRRSP